MIVIHGLWMLELITLRNDSCEPPFSVDNDTFRRLSLKTREMQKRKIQRIAQTTWFWADFPSP